jgi:hypothetical protein
MALRLRKAEEERRAEEARHGGPPQHGTGSRKRLVPRLEGSIPVLPSRNVAETIAFYRLRLGFNCSREQHEYAIVTRDGVEVHVRLDAQRPFRGASCLVRVANLDRLFDELGRRGAVPDNGSIENVRARLRFSVTDCDGNCITFVCLDR